MGAPAPVTGGAGPHGALGPAELRLGAPRRPGEVHVWIVDLDAPAEDASQLLDAAECDRAASYLSSVDGGRFAASRTALRRILGGCLGADPAALRFDTGPGGRPVLAGRHGQFRQEQGRQLEEGRPLGQEQRLQFSLSRSAGVALVAVSAGTVGVDVEAIVPRDGLADLAAARFSAAEADCISGGACGGSPLGSFYRHWTAREAWLKAFGVGLAALRDVEFDCRPAPAIRFRSTDTAPDVRLHLLDCSPEHAGAVVSAGPVTSWERVPAGAVPR